MEEDSVVKVPVSEIREPLQELFTYIPYFEERVNGTFKVLCWDEETDELRDREGYEEHNLHAFPDPGCDETFIKFRHIIIWGIYDKFIYADMPNRFMHTKIDDWQKPEDKLSWQLVRLIRNAHAIATSCGVATSDFQAIPRRLEKIKAILAETPEDAVIVCPRRKPRRKL